MAPPRLVDPKVVDTVRESAGWYRSMEQARFTDQFAAMPSLHVGWSLLVGLAVARALRGRAAYALGLLFPTAMALAVLVTANHYVLDVLVGITVALVALVLASRLPPVVARAAAGLRLPRHTTPATQERAR